MGKYWGWFLGKPVTRLTEMRKKKQNKADKLLNEIKAIDEEIEKRKAEDKA